MIGGGCFYCDKRECRYVRWSLGYLFDLKVIINICMYATNYHAMVSGLTCGQTFQRVGCEENHNDSKRGIGGSECGGSDLVLTSVLNWFWDAEPGQNRVLQPCIWLIGSGSGLSSKSIYIFWIGMVGKNRRAQNRVLEGVQPPESVRIWCRFGSFPRFWFSQNQL